MPQPAFPHAPRLVVTDLDGTLFNSRHQCSPANLATLRELGRRGVIRVIATGRSPYSAHHVLPPDFPIDYLVFSSGAGILAWPSQRLLLAHHLVAPDIQHAIQVFLAHDADFMLHEPIPDNHRFWYRASGRANPDFQRRREWYRDFAAPFDASAAAPERASQFVAIEPAASGLAFYERVAPLLAPLTVVRATSPFDGESFWMEIFPPHVSKADASAWIAARHQIPQAASLAVGNDYNDCALLEWGGVSVVVANAPAELKALYPSVASNDADGFSDAVKSWMPS